MKREYKIMALIVLAFALLVWLASCTHDQIIEEQAIENTFTSRGEFIGCYTKDYSVFYSQDLGSWVISDADGVTQVSEQDAKAFCELVAGIYRGQVLCSYGGYTIYEVNGIWYESYVNNGQVDSYELEDPDGNPADDNQASNRCKQLAGINGE